MRATTPNQQRWIRPWPEVRKGILNARVLAACAACLAPAAWAAPCVSGTVYTAAGGPQVCTDRKSTRLNSSHTVISYAVFCLKKIKHVQTPGISATANPGKHYDQTLTTSDSAPTT